jgi:hypothetical protein
VKPDIDLFRAGMGNGIMSDGDARHCRHRG